MAASDPGFSESPSCLAVAVPEARSTVGMLLTGGGAVALIGAMALRRRRRRGAEGVA
jgi:hypothetical protein